MRSLSRSLPLPLSILLGAALAAGCADESSGSASGTTTTSTGGVGGAGAGGSGGTGGTGGSTAKAPATLKIGAIAVDITPPADDPADEPAAFAACDPKFTGARQFAFQEPYVDTQGSGRYDPGDDFCDANGNGFYDGIYLAGGSGNNRVPVQVKDPLSARVVVFGSEDDKHHVAMVSVDSLGLLAGTILQIADAAKTAEPALEEVLVSSTHDESAPDPVGLWGADETSRGVNDYYLEFLVAQIAGAAKAAYGAAEPAHLRFVQAKQPASFRPIWSSYPFVHDPSIMAMQAVSAADEKKAIFTLANFNFHAEIYGFSPDETLTKSMTADWPGVLRQELESAYGGVGIGLAGLVGSVEMPLVYPGGSVPQTPLATPVNTTADESYTIYDAATGIDPIPHGTEEESVAIGKAVAAAVKGAFDAAPAQWSVTGDVHAVVHPVCFTVENQGFLLALQYGLLQRETGCSGSDDSTSSAVGVLDVGDAQVAFVPGEVFPFTLQRSFLGADDMPFAEQTMTVWAAAKMTRPWTFFAGLGEDGAGYFMPPASFVGLSDEVTIEPWATWDATSPEYDRFGWGHGDDGESLGPNAGVVLADGLVAALAEADPGAATATVATGRFVDEDGNASRSPFPSGAFKGAVGIWVLPDGETDFTPGKGSIYGLPGHGTIGGQAVSGTAGGFVDAHGISQGAAYDVATRGVWTTGADGARKTTFVDVYPGK